MYTRNTYKNNNINEKCDSTKDVEYESKSTFVLDDEDTVISNLFANTVFIYEKNGNKDESLPLPSQVVLTTTILNQSLKSTNQSQSPGNTFDLNNNENAKTTILIDNENANLARRILKLPINL